MTDKLYSEEATLRGELAIAKETISSLEDQMTKQNKTSFIKYIWAAIISFILAPLLWRDFRAAKIKKTEAKVPRTKYQEKVLEIIRLKKDKCGYCEYFKRLSYSDLGECRIHAMTGQGKDPRITCKHYAKRQWIDDTCKKWKLDPEVLNEK